MDKVELDELLRRSDVITLHVPLTEQTRGMLDAAAFAKCRKGVLVINCARGGLIVENDLKAALEAGQVGGAALDVFEVEPAYENPLFGTPNLICTPHLGASTEFRVVADRRADERYLLTAPSPLPTCPGQRRGCKASRLQGPHSSLGPLDNYVPGIKSVQVEYEGHVASLNTRPLTQAVLVGVLRPMLDSVNMVNAPVLARQRDISVAETKYERDCDYQTLIRVRLVTEQQERSVAGTLFGGSKPRVVEIKGIQIEAQLGKHMLYLTNHDRPGVIGGVGRILAEAGMNIATFHLGRTTPGGDAICLIELDDRVPPEVLEKVRALPQVLRAEPLSF